MNSKQSIAQTITDNVIKALEGGTAPWVKPWHNRGVDAPYNPVAKRYYNGINFVQLSMMPASTDYWVTYKQAQSVGAQVRKGAVGVPVVYFSPLEVTDKVTGGILHAMLYKISKFFLVNVVFIQKDQVTRMSATLGWVKRRVIMVVFYLVF